MKRQSIIVAFAGLSFLGFISIFAQADTGKTRYVSQQGKDQGQCDNMFRPCRSLPYAVSVSTKIDRIYVAAGEYGLANADEIYTVGSAAHRIRGGYNRVSGYSERDASRFVSTVVGVPPLYREAFQNAGFKVIADLKGMSRSEQQNVQQKMQLLAPTMRDHTAANCSNNAADGFPCDNIDLYSHLSLGTLKSNGGSANDIWGYYDLNTAKEYVLVGLENGISIIDVTAPEQPNVVATTDGPASFWRDIKVLQNYDAQAQRWRAYAYVSNESSSGIAIIDLSHLPNSVEVIARGGGIFSSHNVYLANVDYTFAVNQPGLQALLSVAGANTNSGNFRLYDLTDPESPEFLATNNYGYMHDAASVRIVDDRKNTQCENASGEIACQVLADFNESTVEVFDITNASQPQHLASITYPGATYVHSGWWTEDGRYLFVQDELDESYGGINTTVRIWDMSDLRNPVAINNWTSETKAIDHNGFVKGNRYYMSHYTKGLTVLDITNPGQSTVSAFFDSVPGMNGTNFSGAWGVYPFFVSDTLAISDINSGLYLLKDNSRQSAQGSIGFSAATYATTEGGQFEVTVARNNGTSGAVSVNVVLVPLTADADDIVFPHTNQVHTLNWADGDGSTKSLAIDVNVDGEVEGIEHFALRLESPTQGATLANNRITMLAVSEPDTSATLAFLNASMTVEDNPDQVMVSVLRKGNLQLPLSATLVATYPASAGMAATEFELQWAANEAAAKNVFVTLPSNNALGDGPIELSLIETENVDTSQLGLAYIYGSQGVVPSPSVTPTPTPTSPPTGSSSSSGGNTGGGSSGGGGAASMLMLVFMGLMLIGFRRRVS